MAADNWRRSKAMSTKIKATYDGQVFRPNCPVPLEPNTAVRLTIEVYSDAETANGGKEHHVNQTMLKALTEIERIQQGMAPKEHQNTLKLLREARSGEMHG